MNGKTNASDITVNQIVNGVLIPLEPATDFKIGSGSGRAYFTWTDPVDKYTTPGDELVSQWEKSVVVRKKDSAPTNIDDGTIVLTETTRNQYSENSYSDEGLENNTNYFYSVYPIQQFGVASDPVTLSVTPIGGDPYFKTYLENPFNITELRWGIVGAAANKSAVYYVNRGFQAVNTIYRINSDYTAATTRSAGYGYPADGSEIGYEYVVFTQTANSRLYTWVINSDATVQQFFDNGTPSFRSVDSSSGINFGNFLAMIDTSNSGSATLSTLNMDLTLEKPASPIISVSSTPYYGVRRGIVKNYGIWKFVNTISVSDDLTLVDIHQLPDISSGRYSGSLYVSKVDQYLIFSADSTNDKTIHSQAFDADLTYYSSDTISKLPMIDNTETVVSGDNTCPSDKQIGSYAIIPLAYNAPENIYGNIVDSEVAFEYIDMDLVVSSKKLSELWQSSNIKYMTDSGLITKLGTDMIMYFSTADSAAETDSHHCAVVFATI